jgi:N,N'-diacetyllegionaminate synthase
MTWYLQTNAHIFKIELIDLPAAMVRDYRLTLDYAADLDLFERLFSTLKERNLPPDLKNIFGVLDQNPDIASINSHITLSYKVDKQLIDKLNRVTKIEI